ncbi:MAG: acetyl xylan esterase [Bacteroides sp. SM23_62_1]|nr:MAG: acetyl xylan esterase [Bacteroides sp. SM23_62_1]
MKAFSFILLLFCFLSSFAQQRDITSPDEYPPPACLTAEQDHQNMMDQLGITKLRPGRGADPSAPNPANYDESKANPYPDLPDLLTTDDGQKVTSPEMWWERRRPEIANAFEREVYGRLPEKIPEVTWEVIISEREFIGWTPVIARKVVGHVDNSEYPHINVDISMVVVTPERAGGPVPVLMMFGPAFLPAPAQPNRDDFEKLNEALRALLSKDPAINEILNKYPAYDPLVRPQGVTPSGFRMPVSGEAPPTHQLISAGWGYVLIDPSSIQADNAEGLTCGGIIGLVNKGQPRKADDWGDSRNVGIEGVSRYGKAALVTLAFEQRFSFGLIGSSGKGGTTLHRRNFGEAVENLTGGEYYWMAGNYMKYGASEGKYGMMNASNLPVDSHGLIAMCAPRLIFISFGIPEKGDANWLDHQGSYMAAVAAGPVFKLLGTPDLGVSNNYMTEKMPGVNQGLLEGNLAWRQHDGGHTDAPNIRYFIEWVNKHISD